MPVLVGTHCTPTQMTAHAVKQIAGESLKVVVVIVVSSAPSSSGLTEEGWSKEESSAMTSDSSTGKVASQFDCTLASWARHRVGVGARAGVCARRYNIVEAALQAVVPS